MHGAVHVLYEVLEIDEKQIQQNLFVFISFLLFLEI